jgi:hypothetical protein
LEFHRFWVRAIHNFNRLNCQKIPSLPGCFFASISSSELLPGTQYFALIFHGVFHLFQLGVFTNVALNTSEEDRTMRFGILTAIFSLVFKKKMESDFDSPANFWTNYDSPFLTYVVLILVLTAGLVVLIRVIESESDSEEPDSMVGSSVERY